MLVRQAAVSAARAAAIAAGCSSSTATSGRATLDIAEFAPLSVKSGRRLRGHPRPDNPAIWRRTAREGRRSGRDVRADHRAGAGDQGRAQPRGRERRLTSKAIRQGIQGQRDSSGARPASEEGRRPEATGTHSDRRGRKNARGNREKPGRQAPDRARGKEVPRELGHHRHRPIDQAAAPRTASAIR